MTDADERCAPGETLSETNRFVLFDTPPSSSRPSDASGACPILPSEHGQFPGRRPSDDRRPGAARPAELSAAGTLLARMARSAGTPVRAQFSNAASADNGSVLFIGAVDQIPSGFLNHVKVSEHLRMIWPSTPYG